MPAVTLLGLTLALREDVYEPAEDSLLLARHVDAAPGERALDLCTGTGLAALVAARAGARVVATDLNPAACRLARSNATRNGLALDAVCADLAAGIAGRFDLVVCNPPYLPTAPEERVRGVVNRALDGGPDGAIVARRVIDALPSLLADDGRARILVSTLQPLDELEARARDAGLSWEELEREPFGMESLAAVSLGRRSGGRRPSEP